MNALRIAVAVLLLLNGGLAIWKWSTGDWQRAPEPEVTPADPARAGLVEGPGHWRPASGATGCFTMGPFANATAQRRMFDRLRGRAERARLRETRARQWRGWWVYLPAVADRDSALQQTARLAAAGLRDYFIVTTGRHENRVSLGLFQSRANALERQNWLKSRDFQAKLGPRYEYEPRYWIDYQADNSTDAVWRYIARAQPDAFRVPIPCPEQALWPPLDDAGTEIPRSPAAESGPSR